MAQDLEARIHNAPTKDEALNLALEAAELCFKAIKIATEPGQRSEIRSRCQSLLDGAERIKLLDEWRPLAPSPSIEPAAPALIHSDASTELLPGSSTSVSELIDVSDCTLAVTRTQSSTDIHSNFNHLSITAAPPFEAIAATSTNIKRLAEPISKRVLATSEQILLLRGSKLNGFQFPPWKGPPNSDEFSLGDGEELFL